MSRQAYISQRVVTPHGILPAAVIVDGEKISGDANARAFGALTFSGTRA